MVCIARIIRRLFAALFIIALGIPARAQQYDPTFDKPQQLSDELNADFAPRLAASGKNVYVVWRNEEPAVLFRKSADGGKTFDLPRILALNPSAGARADVAASGNGVYVVAPAIEPGQFRNCLDVVLYSSADNGDSFPVLPGNPAAHFGSDLCAEGGEAHNPRVAASGTNVYVVWAEVFDPVVSNNGIWLAVSHDNGVRFDTKQIAPPTGAAAAFGSRGGSTPAIAAWGDNVYIAWDDESPDPAVRRKIFFSGSINRGQTFSLPKSVSLPNILVSAPEVAASGSNVYLAWSGNVAGDSVNGNTPAISRTFFSRSDDFGATFSPAKDISGEQGPGTSQRALGAFGQTVLLAWDAGVAALGRQELFVASSGNAGKDFGPVTNPSINPGFVPGGFLPAVAISNFGRFIAWTGTTSPPSVPNTVGNLDVFFRGALDSDGDGLPDIWEKDGIDVDGDGVVDYKLCVTDSLTSRVDCADPLHKDIFVQVDYMETHRPDPTALFDVETAFEQAPVSNPDGKDGITLHLQVNDDAPLPHQKFITFVDLYAIKNGDPNDPLSGHFGTPAERATSQDPAKTLAAKRLAFHYALFAHEEQPDPVTGRPGASGRGEVGGDDFFVAVGGFAERVIKLDLSGATVSDQGTGHSEGPTELQESTFMHELGHNLGLDHGGGDTINCKPNYLSIMSYSFDLLIADRPLDYSREKLDDLDENNLNEAVGLTANGSSLTNDSNVPPTTVFGPPPIKLGAPGGVLNLNGQSFEGAIDWNGNARLDPPPVQADLNNFSGVAQCDGTGTVLTGFDDWQALKFDFRSLPGFTAAATGISPNIREVTQDDIRESRLLNLDAIDQAIQQLPDSAFGGSGLAIQRKAVFQARLITDPGSVKALITFDSLPEAYNALAHTRSLLDGSVGGSMQDDLIVDGNSQAAVLKPFDNLMKIIGKALVFGGEAPFANAGGDQTVQSGTLVSLSGVGSTGFLGQVPSFTWRQVGGPLVALGGGGTSAIVTFTAPPVFTSSVLTFELVVSSGTRISSPAFVNIIVIPIPQPANRPPVANAGVDQAVNSGATVVLDGSASSDPDGDQITFSWRQTGGPTIALQGATTANPSFNAPAVTTQTVLTFELRVSDGILQSTPTIVHVVVNQSGPVFNPPIKLSGDVVISNSDSPKIALSGANVYIAWIGGAGTATDVFFAASSNGGATFSNPVNLSNDAQRVETRVEIASVGANVYVAWVGNLTSPANPTGVPTVFFRASQDGGASFGATISISGDNFDLPQLAASDANVYVVFSGIGSLFVRASNNGGQSFAPASNVGLTGSCVRIGSPMSSCIASAKIAAAGNGVVVAWNGIAHQFQFSPGEDGIFVRTSSDGGVTFSDAVKPVVNADGPTDNQLADMARDGVNLYILWRRNVGAVANLLFKASNNNGVSFGSEVNLTNTAFPFGAGESHLVVSNGNVYVSWFKTQFSSASADLLVRSSNNAGISFGAPVSLRSSSASPFASPCCLALAASGQNVFVAWHDAEITSDGTAQSGLFFKFSIDSGTSFGSETNLGDAIGGAVQMASSGNDAFVVWKGGATGLSVPLTGGVIFTHFAAGAQPVTGSDVTPPVIAATLSSPANARGWHNQDVSVTWTVADPESAVTSSSGCVATTLHEETSGTTLTCSATNAAGLSMTRSVTIRIDKTAPSITPFRMRQANAAGWYNSDVTVDFLCSDEQSGVVQCPGPQTLHSEGTNQSITATVVDVAGNETSITLSGINIDKTPPVIMGARAPLPNANGWNNTNVTVSFSCSDSLSGLAAGSPPADAVLTNEGTGHSVTSSCQDLAGNSSSTTVGNISIDKTPPVITGSRTPQANSFGWNNSDVTVTFTCADAVSGLGSCGPATQNVSTEGANQLRTGTAIDLAGNIATAIVAGINVDKTAPTLLCGAMPPVLWPPDHKLVSVNSTVSIADALSGASGFKLQSVSSSEPDNGLGDGDTANDIQGWEVGTADVIGWLRAERSGKGPGRIYALSYAGTDKAGNAASCTTNVSVPHDQQ